MLDSVLSSDLARFEAIFILETKINQDKRSILSKKDKNWIWANTRRNKKSYTKALFPDFKDLNTK